MERFPLVSVIIDSYNYARFLAKTIDSVLNQTYGRIEVIVVDDGSTDESPQIILGYGDKITPVFKQNGGLASAINAGYAACHGDIVAFLDSDDYWHPEKIARVIEAAIQFPQASVICHPMQNITLDDQAFGDIWPQPMVNGDIKKQVLENGGWWPRPPTSALSFRRGFLEQVMPMPQDNRDLMPDGYLGGLAPFFGDVVSLPEALTYYRIHGQNMWASQDAGERCRYKVSPLQSAKNDFLRQQGLPYFLDARKNFIYQKDLFFIFNELNLFQLSKLAWTYPGERSPWKRARLASKFWLHMLGIRKGNFSFNWREPILSEDIKDTHVEVK